MKQGASAYSGSWLAIDSSNGDVKVDTNTVGSVSGLTVSYTYPSGVAGVSSSFAIEVKCPALSQTTTISDVTKDVSNSASTVVI